MAVWFASSRTYLMPDTLASAKSERERGVCRERWSSSKAGAWWALAKTLACRAKRSRPSADPRGASGQLRPWFATARRKSDAATRRASLLLLRGRSVTPMGINGEGTQPGGRRPRELGCNQTRKRVSRSSGKPRSVADPPGEDHDGRLARVHLEPRREPIFKLGRGDLVATTQEERLARTQGSGRFYDTVGAEVAIALGPRSAVRFRACGRRAPGARSARRRQQIDAHST